ncbi:DUF3105 domain-containing protein [Williamsia muralis]|nr:DUF3105 domain-containing protein [Williamsia muralis]
MTRSRTIATAATILVLGTTGCVAERSGDPVPESADSGSVSSLRPSADNPDPTDDIEGVEKRYYPAALHVVPTDRVRYSFSPPIGGRHDAIWAACTGVVYNAGIRSENAVHSLEHGAVWLTYNPEDLDAEAVESLAERVDGVDYTLLSPYPGLDRPVSVQSWGHQLKVDDADDPRIDQFITATKQNIQSGVYPEAPEETGYPEPGATCAASGAFDQLDPPPFDPRPGTLPEN